MDTFFFVIIELTDSAMCWKFFCSISFALYTFLYGLLLGKVHTTKTFPFLGETWLLRTDLICSHQLTMKQSRQFNTNVQFSVRQNDLKEGVFVKRKSNRTLKVFLLFQQN